MADLSDFYNWFILYSEGRLIPEELIKIAEDRKITIRDAIRLGHNTALIDIAHELMRRTYGEEAANKMVKNVFDKSG